LLPKFSRRVGPRMNRFPTANMLLIAAGKVPKEIGDELSLSVKTVGTYRTRVLEKLKLKNNAELMRYVMERGLS